VLRSLASFEKLLHARRETAIHSCPFLTTM
jgi:hypothetical protein